MVALALGLGVIITVGGCGDDIQKYPPNWPPLADYGRGCPELLGSWDLGRGDTDVLNRSQLFDDDGRIKASSQRLSIGGLGPGEWILTLEGGGRPERQIHVLADSRRCKDGLLEIEREDTRWGSHSLWIGVDTEGGLVVARLEKSERLFSVQADNAGIPLWHVTKQTWGRWPS